MAMRPSSWASAGSRREAGSAHPRLLGLEPAPPISIALAPRGAGRAAAMQMASSVAGVPTRRRGSPFQFFRGASGARSAGRVGGHPASGVFPPRAGPPHRRTVRIVQPQRNELRNGRHRHDQRSRLRCRRRLASVGLGRRLTADATGGDLLAQPLEDDVQHWDQKNTEQRCRDHAAEHRRPDGAPA